MVAVRGGEETTKNRVLDMSTVLAKRPQELSYEYVSTRTYEYKTSPSIHVSPPQSLFSLLADFCLLFRIWDVLDAFGTPTTNKHVSISTAFAAGYIILLPNLASRHLF